MSHHYETPNVAHRLLNMADSAGHLVISGSFTKVRLYFSTRFVHLAKSIDNGEDSYQEYYRANPAYEANYTAPNDAEILEMWHYWLPVSETYNRRDAANQVPSVLTSERVAFHLAEVRRKIEIAQHPYDKVGAILSSFKAYRAEVSSVLGRPLRTMHRSLRHSMTRFMFRYAALDLGIATGPVVPAGFSTVLQDVYATPQVQAHLNDDPPPYLPHRSYSSFLSFAADDSQWTDSWLGNQNEIINSRECLGKVLQSMPGPSITILDPYGDNRFTSTSCVNRTPPVWFVLKHYLMTHSEKTWDRNFFFDAVLRKSVTHPSVTQADMEAEAACQEDPSDEKIPARLCPLMADSDFDKLWAQAYGAAWRDYRHLRQLTFDEDYSTAIAAARDPSAGEMVHALRQDPANVLKPPFCHQPREMCAKLLERVVPGVGSSYQAVLSVHEFLGSSPAETKAAFIAAVEDIQQNLPDSSARDDFLPELV
jgi:hypothetical protein